MDGDVHPQLQPLSTKPQGEVIQGDNPADEEHSSSLPAEARALSKVPHDLRSDPQNEIEQNTIDGPSALLTCPLSELRPQHIVSMVGP